MANNVVLLISGGFNLEKIKFFESFVILSANSPYRSLESLGSIGSMEES